ncbi:serine/threonine-protein phosphatase 7 long form homolog [Nicotiana sylvestris]|uniref:serine/threonine-protein phosphatase 7 long form homolog n=1 Tax=Nicotiana sylvestris TaxID=4096 RepID=UPI00388C72BB
MDAPIHPGPYSRELLVLQGDHRSAHIWEGELLSQTLRARRVDDLWDFLRHRVLQKCVVHRLQDTGFYRIIEIGRIQVDWSLIMVLIERWRPEKHTFHLPISKATITLQDVEVLYGLPVDGMPVSLPIAMRFMSRDAYLDMLQQLTGFRPQDETASSGASRWGVAVLGYMYRQMCRASMGTQRDVCGFMPLLQVWAWERFLQFHPPRPQLPPTVAPSFLPLARRWVSREYDAHHNLPLYRDVLDLMEGAQAIGIHTVYQMGLQMHDYAERDVDMATTDDYIQEPDEIVVSTGLKAPYNDPVSTTDDHAAAHPAIRRRLDYDVPDSVPRRDAMRLSPAAALKHNGCETH